MNKDTVILLTEDDLGHAKLIKRNLEASGIDNLIIHFSDGQKVLDFLFRNGSGPHRKDRTPYVLLTDLNMPFVSGIEVMKSLNKDDELKKIPVVVISTTENYAELEKYHDLGCVRFISKPVECEQFVDEIRMLAGFLIDSEVPRIDN